jgi:hypothetical protein
VLEDAFLEPQEDHLDGMHLADARAELVLQHRSKATSTIERVTGAHHEGSV